MEKNDQIKQAGLIGLVIASIFLVIANLMGDVELGQASGASVIIGMVFMTFTDKVASVLEWGEQLFSNKK